MVLLVHMVCIEETCPLLLVECVIIRVTKQVKAGGRQVSGVRQILTILMVVCVSVFSYNTVQYVIHAIRNTPSTRYAIRTAHTKWKI